MVTLSIKKTGKLGTFYFLPILVCLLGVLWCNSILATMTGVCSDCHTMHNSQNNAPMNFNGSAIPNNNLTRGTCLGCHAQNTATAIVMQGTSGIPQVMHTGTNDLAGGNFAYITGAKGSGAADNKGHNIGELTGTDHVLSGPPGGIRQFGHDNGLTVNTNNLTCAGTNGCHGYRYAGPAYPEGITGSHHKNVDGMVTVATAPANSYRFLMGTKGLESADWQANGSSANHNEYLGLSSPVRMGCGGGGELSCHAAGGVQPPNGTMSQFCATCHGNFHTLATLTSNGVGNAQTSPFIRHPTDLSLPATGEYAAYTTYNLNSPVARIAVPAAASSGVTPGSDAVMCLSCHVSHASNYSSMLRWDYSTMIAGNGGSASNSGCFACHTSKD
jgi:hypothetical protein